MRITAVEYERHDLRLAEPYTIAYETIDRASNFILRLHATDGPREYVGIGCAAPDVPVTGETAAEVEAAIRDVIAPALTGEQPLAYARLLRDLEGVGPSALCMVDTALHDLVARRADMPLYRFLGAYRDAIATSVTVGILPVDETLERVRAWHARGFTIVKVKGGASLGADLERLTLIRELFPDLTLRFDGNQGYTEAEAIDFSARARPLGLEILEQPTTVHDEPALGAVTARVRLPVMADESLKTLADAFRLARDGRVDMVNIKLQKVGGIQEGLAVNAVARAAGLEAMVGCMDECAVGIAAGLHFALSRANVTCADLDGHLDFVDDPYADTLFTLEGGVLRPNPGPGLG